MADERTRQGFQNGRGDVARTRSHQQPRRRMKGGKRLHVVRLKSRLDAGNEFAEDRSNDPPITQIFANKGNSGLAAMRANSQTKKKRKMKTRKRSANNANLRESKD